MIRPVLLAATGIVTTVIGFSKTIEPMIEVGIALVIAALITRPRVK